MTPGEIIALVGGVGAALFGAAATLWKIATLASRVDLLWTFHQRRAEAELIQKGFGTKNSPLMISKEAKSYYKDLAHSLRAFYAKVGRHLTDRELFEALEKQFGAEITHKVCVPAGLSQGACLLIAMEIAKNQKTS